MTRIGPFSKEEIEKMRQERWDKMMNLNGYEKVLEASKQAYQILETRNFEFILPEQVANTGDRLVILKGTPHWIHHTLVDELDAKVETYRKELWEELEKKHMEEKK